jgi:hypothetical protein
MTFKVARAQQQLPRAWPEPQEVHDMPTVDPRPDAPTVPARLIDLIPPDLPAEAAELLEALKPITEALKPICERIGDYMDRCDRVEKELVDGIDTSSWEVRDVDALNVVSLLTRSIDVNAALLDIETLIGPFV